jgi:hypothetical protein
MPSDTATTGDKVVQLTTSETIAEQRRIPCCDVCRKPSGALFGRICVYCERDGHLPRYSERRVIVPPTLSRRSALN